MLGLLIRGGMVQCIHVFSEDAGVKGTINYEQMGKKIRKICHSEFDIYLNRLLCGGISSYLDRTFDHGVFDTESICDSPRADLETFDMGHFAAIFL